MSDQDVVSYADAASAWRDHAQALASLVERYRPRAVCELGGGANPALAPDCIAAHGLDYTLLDISAEELAKAPAGYAKLQADLCDPRPPVGERFDFVFSKMLIEHVADGQQLHRNVLAMLRPGGLAFHFFPTLFCPPFVANRVLRSAWSGWLLDRLAPRDPLRHKKFPAYYRGCRGPSAAQIRNLQGLGYRVVAYRGFFGHGYYARLPGVREAHRLLSSFLVRHPSPHLTSYAYLLLEKPRAAAGANSPVAARA